MKKKITTLLISGVMALVGISTPLFSPVGVWDVKVYANETGKDRLVEVIVPDGVEYIVLDVLDGVEARYRTMTHRDMYGEYSCAGYVKAYYQAVFGVDVYNLTDLGPPNPIEFFMRVEKPQKGDIIFYPSPPKANNHSAIVKSFDGNRITLIEQDYKWEQPEGTFAYVDRTIPYPANSSHPYEIWRLVFVSDIDDSEPLTVVDYPTATEVPADNPEESDWAEESPEETEPNIAEESPEETEPDITEESPEETTPEFDPALPSVEVDANITDESPEDVHTNEASNNPEETVPAYSAEVEIYEALVTIGHYAIRVNGVDMPIDAPALISQNRTIMPVRWIAYAMGMQSDDLQWDKENRTVTVQNGSDTIIFKIDSAQLTVNQETVIMDCPALLYSDRAYLPVKYLADALSILYEWDGATRSVTFYKGQYS